MGQARGEGKEVRCMDSPTGSQINFNDQAIIKDLYIPLLSPVVSIMTLILVAKNHTYNLTNRTCRLFLHIRNHR